MSMENRRILWEVFFCGSMEMGAQVGGCFLKRSYATCFPVLGTPVSGRRAKGGEDKRKKF